MKRLFLLAAAAASLAAAMPAGEALARDHGRGRGWDQQDRGDQRRGDPRARGEWRGRQGDERPQVERYQAQARDRGYDEERARRYEDDRRARSAPPEAPPPRMLRAPSPRRGGYLPDSYRGAVVDDYRAYRLRPPPRGFSWVRVGAGFALVDMSDGRIYDMVQ